MGGSRRGEGGWWCWALLWLQTRPCLALQFRELPGQTTIVLPAKPPGLHPVSQEGCGAGLSRQVEAPQVQKRPKTWVSSQPARPVEALGARSRWEEGV